MALNLSSSAFQENGDIPSQYTCEGENVSPPLKWTEGPKETKSFALIVDDPDAPSKVWVHWVVFNIPAEVTEILEGHSPKASMQGINDYKKAEYRGPCPPSGKHRYFFKLYALDKQLDLQEGATKEAVEKAMEGHILEKTELMGKYRRKER